MKKKVISLITALCLSVCLLGGVSLQTNAYPSTAVLNISSLTELQQQSNWCWAACSVTTPKYYGNSVTQTQFVNTALGVTGAPNLPAGMSTVITGINNWGKTGTIYNGYVSYGTVISDIANNKPLFAGLNTGLIGHMVLIVGYDGVNSSTGYVMYYNPTNNSITGLAYNTFKSSWVETIKSVRNL